MNLEQKSFFIGMMYPKIVKNLEENNIHIRIKSDSWGDHEIERINSMLGALYEKFVWSLLKLKFKEKPSW